MKRNQTRRLTLAAMMGAVSFVLMYFSFSVPVLSPLDVYKRQQYSIFARISPVFPGDCGILSLILRRAPISALFQTRKA